MESNFVYEMCLDLSKSIHSNLQPVPIYSDNDFEFPSVFFDDTYNITEELSPDGTIH